MNPIYSLHNDSCIENQKLCRMCKKKSSVQKLRSRFDDFRSDEVFLGGPYRQAFLDTAYQLPYAHDLQVRKLNPVSIIKNRWNFL